MVQDEASVDQIERSVRQRIAGSIMTPHVESRVAEGFEKPRVDVGDYNFPFDAYPFAQPRRDGSAAAASSRQRQPRATPHCRRCLTVPGSNRAASAANRRGASSPEWVSRSAHSSLVRIERECSLWRPLTEVHLC